MGLYDFDINIINYYVLIPAVLIILGLSFLEKRKFKKEYCNGRPGLIIPFRFLDGYSNRIGIALAFGTALSSIVTIIGRSQSVDLDEPLWLQALVLVYFRAFVACLTCFPLFACLTTKFKVVGASIIILYSILWFSLQTVQIVRSFTYAEESVFGQMAMNKTRALQLGQAFAVLEGLPLLICYMLLIATSVHTLYRCFVNKSYIKQSKPGTMCKHQEQYVRWVFQKSRHQYQSQISFKPKSFAEQLNERAKVRLLKSFEFFKYPARIFAVAFLQVIVAYWFGLGLVLFTILLISLGVDATEGTLPPGIILIVIVCPLVALLFSIVVNVCHIIFFLRNYRYHILRIYQGDKVFIPNLKKSPQAILTRSMAFPGYQFGFFLWGFVLNYICMLLVLITIAGVAYLLHEVRYLDKAALTFLQSLCFPATILGMYFLQVYFTKRVLLQPKIKEDDNIMPLNVDNRKLYEILGYYSVFSNTAVGMFSCFLRITKSSAYSLFFVGRLDKCVLTRDWEASDNGYVAYMCMLLVDNAHNNPTMRVFAHLLWTRILAAREARQGDRSTPGPDASSPSSLSRTMRSFISDEGEAPPIEDGVVMFSEASGTQLSKRARTRWALALTLLNNPDITRLRKHALTLKSNRKSLSTNLGHPTDDFA